MFLFFLLRIIKPYTKSKYGYTGTDTVQAQECDNLIVLEQIPKPTVRYINESGWTSRKNTIRRIWMARPYENSTR